MFQKLIEILLAESQYNSEDLVIIQSPSRVVRPPVRRQRPPLPPEVLPRTYENIIQKSILENIFGFKPVAARELTHLAHPFSDNHELEVTNMKNLRARAYFPSEESISYVIRGLDSYLDDPSVIENIYQYLT